MSVKKKAREAQVASTHAVLKLEHTVKHGRSTQNLVDLAGRDILELQTTTESKVETSIFSVGTG